MHEREIVDQLFADLHHAAVGLYGKDAYTIEAHCVGGMGWDVRVKGLASDPAWLDAKIAMSESLHDAVTRLIGKLREGVVA